jgi:hypothetical protein
MRVKITGATIELDGKDVSESVRAMEIKITPDGSEVILTLAAEVNADLEAELLALEKKDHVRFTSLNRETRFVRNRL